MKTNPLFAENSAERIVQMKGEKMNTNNLPERLREESESLMRCGTEGTEARLMREAADEIEQLRAIVDKLPKCWRLNERGELVQDIIIKPEMTVYFILMNYITLDRVESIGTRIFLLKHTPLNSYQLYSTREAAEAAEEE